MRALIKPSIHMSFSFDFRALLGPFGLRVAVAVGHLVVSRWSSRLWRCEFLSPLPPHRGVLIYIQYAMLRIVREPARAL